MKVLFIGNSFQYASNVSWDYSSDGNFVALSEAAGITIDWHGNYIGGSVLSQHWNDSDANNPRDQLENGNYDVVVINGGNGGNDPAVAAQFANLAAQNGTDVVFFNIWAPDHEISISGGDNFEYVHKTYLKMAQDNDAALSPNGRAYAAAHTALTAKYGNGDNGQTAENMLTYDGIHPSPLAGYLAGLVLFATVHGTKPPAPSAFLPKGVSLADGQMMYDIAWKAVQDYAIMLNGSSNPPPSTGTITGRMFDDLNANSMDDSEGGLAGVTVYLWEEGVGVVATTTTKADGSYTFSNVDAGDYRVRFADAGATKSFVTGNVGTDANDSDVTQILTNGIGVTGIIKVTAGATVANVDAGAKTDGSSGGGTGGGTTPADYDKVINGTSASETLRGGTTDDYMTGQAGNDYVNGGDGDDYVDGGLGRDTLVGGNGADVFIFDKADAAINGGTGLDTLMFTAKAATDARAVTVYSVETFNMTNAYADDVTLSYRQIRQAKDAELTIKADAGDIVRIDSTYDVKLLGTFTKDGQIYERYQLGGNDWGTKFAIDADAKLYVDGTLI